MIADAVRGIFEGAVKPILDKWIPDAKDRLEAEQLFFSQSHQINLGQLEINRVEASSERIFVAGWRPAVGWVCAASFAYAVVGNDVLNWTLEMINAYTLRNLPMLPEPDTTLTFELLLVLLGVGTLRTYEKINGVAK